MNDYYWLCMLHVDKRVYVQATDLNDRRHRRELPCVPIEVNVSAAGRNARASSDKRSSFTFCTTHWASLQVGLSMSTSGMISVYALSGKTGSGSASTQCSSLIMMGISSSIIVSWWSIDVNSDWISTPLLGALDPPPPPISYKIG